MKKFFIFLLIFASCGGSETTQEIVTTTTSNVETATDSTTTTIAEEDLMFENFHNYWKRYRLDKAYNVLTVEEMEITIAMNSDFFINDSDNSENPDYYYPYNDNPFSTVVIYENQKHYEGEFTTCIKQKESSGLAILDQNHPVDWIGNIPHVVPSTYVCDGEDIDFLWGLPFYQNGKWWIFKSIPISNNDRYEVEGICEDPCEDPYTHRGTRVEFRPIRGVFFDQQTEQIEFLNDFSDKYDEISYEIPHDVINFAIFYPKINFNQQCADVMEKDLLEKIDAYADYKIELVENFLEGEDSVTREEVAGFEWLQLTYDVLEINSEYVSIIYRWNEYSYGAAHSQDSYFSTNYFLTTAEKDYMECEEVKEIDDIKASGRGFQSHYYQHIYQQLCLPYEKSTNSNSDWLGCDSPATTNAPEGVNPSIMYPYEIFSDIKPTPEIGFTRYGIFIQFENYSLGSYAQGAPRIIIPYTHHGILNNDLALFWIVRDMEDMATCYPPTVYEPYSEYSFEYSKCKP
tara:strand:+ start:14 stop:1558 length:1545 start_codon:yes stop_codon:yes gene_type:complete